MGLLGDTLAVGESVTFLIIVANPVYLNCSSAGACKSRLDV